MGMDVAGSEVAEMNGDVKPIFHENGNANISEPIKFGSHGFEEQKTNGDAVTVSNANVPINAVDEWPVTPKTHSFWVVKYRSYEDPILKAKIDQVDKEIQKINQRTGQITEQLKPKRAARVELKEKLMSLASENSQYGAVLNEKRQEMKPLQDALGTLRGSGGPVGICSTEQELNDVIRSLEYKMQHESLSLKEEKQLIREIKELEATRPKVIANTARRAKIQDSLGKTEVIQGQVKLLGTDLDEVRKQRAALKARMDNLGQQVKAIDDQISPLQTEYTTLDGKRKQAFETIKQLRSKRDEVNACFYQNRNVINGVRELAAKKDLKAVKELVHTEVEKFMSQWNSSKGFRDDYEKRILTSLDMRQLSRDGRIRNFEEKRLVMAETPKTSQVEVAAPRKPEKEESKASVIAENSTVQKAEKESKKNNKDAKSATERVVEEEEVFMVEKPKKREPKENEMDEAKLKEMKREEEKEKQRQALERKKKLQEKAAAKAAARAHKEAERKQQKKLKKKESTSNNEEDPTEAEPEATEHENDIIEEAIQTPAPPPKAKEAKQNTLKHRKTTTKTRGMLPKAILKKKKSDNHWIWAAYAAAAAVFVILLYLALTYLL